MNTYKLTKITLKDNNFKIAVLFKVNNNETEKTFIFNLDKTAEDIKEAMNTAGLALEAVLPAHTTAKAQKTILTTSLDKEVEIVAPPKASDFESKAECEKAGFYWFNNKCNASQEEII